MARKSKTTLINAINQSAAWDPTLADEMIDWCSAEARKLRTPVDPYAELIDARRLTGAAFEAWSSHEARKYISERMARHSQSAGGSGDVPAWDSKDELVAAAAAIELMERHFVATSEHGMTLYKLLDAERRIIEPCVQNNLTAQVSQRLKHAFYEAGQAATNARSSRILDLYLNNCEPAEKPKLWAWIDEPGYAIARASVLPDATVPFPHIQDGFLCRLNDPDAFCAYWWGVYSGRYKGRQILYISDIIGESGKSSFLRALIRLLGDVITAALNWAIISNSSHASSHFAGKKFVVIGDNKNPAIIMSQAMKELSGDDMTMLNPKHLPAYSTYLECRPIITSNHPPLITSERHNQSRTLWLVLEPLGDAPRDPAFVAHYDEEMPGFLAHCERCYNERCINDYEIQVNDAVKEAVRIRIGETEVDFVMAFDEHLVLDEDGVLTDKKWHKLTQDLFSKQDKHQPSNFMNWLMANFSTVTKRTTRNGRGWEMRGIRLKTDKSGDTFATRKQTRKLPGAGHIALPSPTHAAVAH